MITDPSRVPLAKRLLIANGAASALVSADGTIDWYCPDGVQAAPVLWRLLDASGGAMRVGPERVGSRVTRFLPSGSQRYRPETNIAETVLDGGGGRRVLVTDFLPWPGPGLEAPRTIVRIVRALSGPVDVEVEVYPSGRLVPPREVVATSEHLIFDGITVHAGAPFAADPLGREVPRWRAIRRLGEGGSFVVTLGEASEAQPLTLDGAARLLEETETAWRGWIGFVAYGGPFRQEVARSLLAVRALTGATGAPLGSATLSLPRRTGSERNSDDRWVRWSTVAGAARTYAAAGLAEDSEACEAWLRNALVDAPLPLPIWLYPDGRPAPPRKELNLEGWRRSQPVVAGVPEGLIDLDSFGDVVAAIGASRSGPGATRSFRGDTGPLRAAWEHLGRVADWLADHWHEPDVGVWATDGPPALLAASRLQSWYALDRMASLAWEANPLDLSAIPWRQTARDIVSWMDKDVRAPDGGLRRDAHPGHDDDADAALLRIAWRGPWPVSHPIVVSTVDRTLERLGSSGLLHRYSDRVDDGRAGPDNPDLVASLWAVRALAALGRWEEAHDRFEAVTGLAGPGGLLSEAADPVSGELMGNIPSTPVHLALVDAATALAQGPA